MEYRQLGRAGIQVSEVGLGTEYMIGAERAHIIATIRYAIEHEINYFDLFPANPEFRTAMGEAFHPFRSQVLLGAHLGAMVADTQYDRAREIAVCLRWFEDFLQRYHTDYVDVLFLHNIDAQDDYDAVFAPGGMAELAKRYKQAGTTRAIGYSGHAVSTSLQAVESGLVDVLLFPVNLASNTVIEPAVNSAATIHDLLHACAQRGVAVIAMKPYAGGQLLNPTQPGLESVTPVQCLAYALAQPAVATVVPGCKDSAQIDAALGYLSASPSQRAYDRALVAAQQHAAGECVYCNHCLPCPSAIDIAHVMRLLDLSLLENTTAYNAAYTELNALAGDCIRCGACEARCPFGVPVVERMEQMADLYGT